VRQQHGPCRSLDLAGEQALIRGLICKVCWPTVYDFRSVSEKIDVAQLNGHQLRSEKSTRLLIQAAGQLIAEQGYAGVTLATVGERAGYSRGLATARFGSKAALLDALVDHIVTRWNFTRVVPHLEGKSGLAALVIMLESIRDAYVKSPESLSVLYALTFEALGPTMELRERFATLHANEHRNLANVISKGIEDGSIDPRLNPDVEAQLILATLRGIGYEWRLDPEGFDPVSCLDHLIVTTRKRLAW
jgi:AcrR family transcriptional regulator